MAAISLEREAEREQLSVDDEIKRSDADLRRFMVRNVMQVFTRANWVTMIALCLLVTLDEANVYFHLVAPADRIIDHQVIMTLLGATTVQVGAVAVIIARYLFPGTRSS